MITEWKQAHTTFILFFFTFFMFYYIHSIYWYDQKLELHLRVVLILFKIKFKHNHISVAKIGKPTSKTASLNLCQLSKW